MASLLILRGPNQGQRLPINSDKIALGRNPDCQVVIAGSAVSREHAYIVRVQGKFFIEDNQSRNGTFVNNQQVTGRTPLKDNDRIKICDFLCTFLQEASTPKPLPADLQPDPPEEEEPAGQSTVEASFGLKSSNQLLESQPAEKLRLLLEITNSLAKTLDLDPLLPKIADNLFQLFRQADRCFLILREGNERLIPKLIKTRRAQNEANARFSRTIVRNCLETLQAFLSEDAQSDSKVGMAQSIADFRIRSVMCVPLTTQDGKGMGVIQLDTQDRTKKFTKEDLELLMGVAGQASIALENAKLHQDLVVRERMQRDLELAKEVQRGFLPQKLPQVNDYGFYAHYEAALQVGGDYYDFIPLPGGKLAIVVGDVAGKGMPAALLMAKLSADARFTMLTESVPAAAITKLNSRLAEANLNDRFVTLAACILDPVTHQVVIVNAGHMPPLVYRHATGTVENTHSEDITGLPLGVFDPFEYTSCEIELKPGDNVFVFTDGISEAMNLQNQPFGLERMHRAVLGEAAVHEPAASPQTQGERLVKAAKQYAANRSPHDDVTLVGFGRVAGSVDPSVTAVKGSGQSRS